MPIGRIHEYWLTDSIKHEPFEKYFDVVKELGRGVMSNVLLCEKKRSGFFWSAKIINKAVNKPVIRAEMGMLLRLSHPNLVRVKDIYETPQAICLILELMTGGELLDRLTTKGEYTERDVSQCMRDILAGLKYLHENDIVHRDLKVENFLYKDASENAALKIADFGLSQIISSDIQMHTVCDTPGYVAPEVLRGEYSEKPVDMWSVGVILYILLCGYEPFGDTNRVTMFRNIFKCNYKFPSPDWDDISENAKDVITKLLVHNPANRMTAGKAFNHPWVRGKANKSIHLQTAQDNLKIYNKECKLRSATSEMRALAKLQEESTLGRLPSHMNERGERLFTDDIARRRRVLPPFDPNLEKRETSRHDEITEKEFLLYLQREMRIRPPFDTSLEDRRSSREGEITERSHIREVERITRVQPPFDPSLEQRHSSHTGEEGEVRFVQKLSERMQEDAQGTGAEVLLEQEEEMMLATTTAADDGDDMKRYDDMAEDDDIIGEVAED